MSDLLKIKDPDAVLDYTIDWSDYLQAGETIASSTWNVMPASTSASFQIDSMSKTSDTATVRVTGGSVGHIYRLVNQVVTSSTRTDDRSLTLRVEHE